MYGVTEILKVFRQRAAKEMIRTAEAAKRLGVNTVTGFTGSSIWPLLYSFPSVTPAMIDKGYEDFAAQMDTDPRQIP